MPCFSPSRVGIKRKAWPGAPVLQRTTYSMVVPCGHCLGCRAEQSRQWMVRCMHESRMHRFAVFVTLTYERVPTYGSLRANDLKRFFKDLRREGVRFSYYAVGEYGEFSQRPHYHALLYGAPFLDRYLWTHRDGTPIFRSPLLESVWPHGLSELGTVTEASASYVTGYVRKKVRRKDLANKYLRVCPDTGEVVEVAPEFTRMSLRPAIGRRWIEKYWRDVYPRDFVVVNGKECKPPRYYDKFMDLPDEEGGSEERRVLMAEVRQARWDDMEDDIKDREFPALPREKRMDLKAREVTRKSLTRLFDARSKV